MEAIFVSNANAHAEVTCEQGLKTLLVGTGGLRTNTVCATIILTKTLRRRYTAGRSPDSSADRVCRTADCTAASP